MTSNSDTSWMPVGRHKFNIGSSLSIALKARKGVQSKRNNNLPVRDFYSFRYNFKPNSLDMTKPGNIEVTTKKENTTVAVEHASVQPGEAYSFTGLEKPAGELDCVLVYDEDMGSFTLEKLDSYITLQHEKKIQSTLSPPKPSPKTLSPPEPSAAAPAPKAMAEVEEDDLGADFDSALEALQGGSDYKTQAKEPQEEIFEDFLAPNPQPPPPPPKKIDPVKKQDKKPKIAPPGKLKKKASPVPQPSARHPDAEDLDFGRPAQPAQKKQRLLDEGLALPGSSFTSGLVQPLPSYDPPQSQHTVPVTVDDSEEDEDMELVQVTAGSPAVPEDTQDADLDIFGSEIEDEMTNAIEDEFENEMNLAFEGDEEEDFLAPVVEAEEDGGGGGGGAKIKSLSEMAENDDSDEDDFSSSEESDDD